MPFKTPLRAFDKMTGNFNIPLLRDKIPKNRVTLQPLYLHQLDMVWLSLV